MQVVVLSQDADNKEDTSPSFRYASCSMASCKDMLKHNISSHGNGLGQSRLHHLPHACVLHQMGRLQHKLD
jgi:hypothetical protein